MAPLVAANLFFAVAFAASSINSTNIYYASARVEVLNIFIFISTNLITITCHDFKSN